jgi:hypothetical protein
MKLKIFKSALFLIALLAIGRPVFAQDTPENYGSDSKKPSKSRKTLNLKLDLNMKDFDVAMNNLSVDLHKSLNVLVPQITANIKDLVKDIDFNVSVDGDMDSNDENGSGGVDEKVKTYSKTYAVDANDKLEVTNKFGKVTVNTWNKNEIKVDVQIKSIAGDDRTAQKMIDAISISDSKDGNVVSFRTNFGGSGDGNSIWNLFNNRNDHHKAEVNYTIYMPSKIGLEIDNRYGATEIPDFDGKVEINSAYGSFVGKALTHAGNEIKVKYGSASIESLNSCDLDVGYGSLNLGSVDKLNADVSYSSVKIGKIKGSAEINARYAGGVQIDELDKNFTSFSANASYSSVKIGVSNATNADFDVTVKYGGFDYNDLPVTITQKSPSDSERGFHPTQNYKGRIGKGSSDRTISIRSTYGGVKFE